MNNTKEKYQLRYLVMPDYVYQDNDLTDIARRVYCFIHSYNGEKFFFSNDHLSEMFNCAGVSISRAMTLLEELDYIEIDYKIKSEGGKIRFVTDLVNKKSRMIIGDNSDLSPVITQTYHRRSYKDNNKKIITKSKLNIYNGQAVGIKQREDSSPIGKKVHSDSKDGLPSVKKVYSDREESSLGHREESSHYNDNTNNDSNNDISTNVDNGQAVVLAEAETSLVIDGKTFNETIYLFKPVNPSVNRLFAQKGQRSALERLIKQHGIEKIRGMIELLPLLLKEPYAPIITTPYQLEAKLGQVIAFMERRKHGESKRGIDARGIK